MSYLTKIEMVKKKVTIGLKCDICGNTTNDEYDNNWVKVEHQHYEWVNDSCESYENFHVCSPECFIKQIKRSIQKLKDSDSGEINDMPLSFVKNLIAYIRK